VTGIELIKFIQNNKLENEDITIEYFSWERKQKFCKMCSNIESLNNFHRGTSGTEPETSSYYRYICKSCLNKAAFHKKYNKKDYIYE
jgi:hypothetical protein